jgi:hypothetical protein
MSTTRIYTALAVSVAMVSAATSSRSYAQFTTATSSTHHWLAIGVGAGELIPTGNASTGYQSSFQGEAYVIINLGILPELRFNFGYQRFNLKNQLLSSLGYPSATGAHNSILDGIAGTRIDLMRGPVRPYLTLGVGAFNIRTVVDTGALSKTGSASSLSTTKFGLDGGAGLAVHVGRVEAFVEGRVQNVYTDKGFISSAKQISAVPVTGGLLFSIF